MADDAEFTDVNIAPDPAVSAEDQPEKQPETVENTETEGEEQETDAEKADGDEEKPLRDDKGRFKNGVQARIDELTRRAHEAERRAARAEAAAVAAKTPGNNAAPAKPTADQFEDYGDYVEALTDWKADQRDAERAKADLERHSSEYATERQENWAAKVEASKASLPDFDTVVGASELPIAAHVGEALLDAEKGPELAYHLAQHPDVAQRLNKMSAYQAAMELGRIEATLGTQVPEKQPTKAPTPITPVRTGSSTKADISKVDDMDAYIEQRRKQGARY